LQNKYKEVSKSEKFSQFHHNLFFLDLINEDEGDAVDADEQRYMGEGKHF
jgi:hypothetical protein